MDFLNRKAIKAEARAFIRPDRKWFSIFLAILPYAFISNMFSVAYSIQSGVNYSEGNYYQVQGSSWSFIGNIIKLLAIPFGRSPGSRHPQTMTARLSYRTDTAPGYCCRHPSSKIGFYSSRFFSFPPEPSGSFVSVDAVFVYAAPTMDSGIIAPCTMWISPPSSAGIRSMLSSLRQSLMLNMPVFTAV